jgi:2,5-furandicarboxylate decarboxylase 1
VADTAPVKDVEILRDIDILKTMPVLTHYTRDASPYFTCAITIARDPDTGIQGMGIHRIQVKDQNTLGIFLATPPLSSFLAKTEAKREPLEIAVVIGVDPVTFFASVVWAPAGIDKFEIAGGLRGKPIELVKCSTVDLEVPAYAEFVLEGKIIPGERQPEGPFGESTGYYFSNKSPVAKITAITHRRDAIYQSLVPFSGEEMVLLELGWEMKHLPELKNIHSFVRKIHFTNMLIVAIVQIKKTSDEDSRKIIEELWGNPFIKIVIVVDEDIDPYDAEDVSWAIATRVRPDRDVVMKADLPGLPIDPSADELDIIAEFSLIACKTSKLGIDATKTLKELDRFERTDVPENVKRRISHLVLKYVTSLQK